MAISRRTSQAIKQGGWIRQMFEIGIKLKQQHGEDKVFDLSLGNPVMEPPQKFGSELHRLATNPDPGMHRYMPNAGYTETRSAVAYNLKKETGIPFTLNEIIMTCGAAGALNVILETILNPGDEVIIFAPFFGEFTFYIENHQGTPVIAPTNDVFHPNLEALETLITNRTRAVIINSPNNPSGALYPSTLIKRLGELLTLGEEKHGSEIFLISDEPYRRIIFDGLVYPHIFQHYHAAVSVHSHSKDLGIPGERVGYIAVNPFYDHKAQFSDGAIFWNRSLGFVNAPALMQNVIRSCQEITVDISEYQRKRDYLYDQLTTLGYRVVKPQGAFYMFPESPVADDVLFVAELQKWKVLAVPGSGFGMPGFFRISYCVEDWVLRGAVEGLAQAAKHFRT